ncbi:MAG: leucine-rich repeat domain-containing protein [Bacteroidota bacterium]
MLSIKYISIDLVQDWILKLSDLETLMLKTNSIKAIPDLSLLGKLKELIIHSNNLPVSLVVPGYLRELELLSIYSYRKTEEFICPDNLKLQRLVLYMNNIKKLHPSIYNLDSLEYLDLSNNQLSSIDLKRFKKLKKVIIAHNPIDDISSIKKKCNNIEVIF